MSENIYSSSTNINYDDINIKSLLEKSKQFNRFNSTLGLVDKHNNILTKFLSSTVEKVITKNNKPIFFIRYYKGTHYNTIETLVVNDLFFEEDFNDNLHYVKSEIIDKNMLLGNNNFIYYVSENEENNKLLTNLGFSRTDSRFMMHKDLDEKINYIHHDLEDELEVRKVITKYDIKERVKVQNDIFENKNRIPLEERDVLYQMKDGSYIDDLSLLLFYKNIAVGYGQIVKEKNNFYLVNFGISHNFRSKNFSDYLLQYMLLKCKDLEINTLYLEVFGENNKAIGLYLKHGFKVDHLKVTYKYNKNGN